MAKSKEKDKNKSVNTPANYKAWLSLHGFSSKKESKKYFESMTLVRDFYQRSRNYLMTSCYHDMTTDSATGAVVGSGSWYDRRALQKKMAIMWYQQPSADDFKSNIKAPMARGRINTFVNWMKRVNLEFGAKPNDKNDTNAAIVADKTINNWFQNSDVKLALGDANEERATHGNAYLKLTYLKEYKNYTFPKTKDLDKDESKRVKENGEIIYNKPVETLITDDLVVEHVPIDEVFPDPTGLNLHGTTGRAGKIARRRWVTLDYLSAVYGNHPNVKNLDKVKGGTHYTNMDNDYFFKPPTDYLSDEIVELIELEDQDNDKYYVIANDIPIIGADGDTPLPQAHKEISYHKLDFLRVPGQYHSLGLCDLLENIQGAYEIGMNMIADYVYRTYNYKLAVDANNFGNVVDALTRTGSWIFPINVADGKPINSKIMPLQVSPVGFDIFNFLSLLEKNATLATNIDPAQMAMLAGSKTATSDMLNKELLMTMLGGIIYNDVNGDMRSLGRQVWKMQQQYYSVKRVKEIVGDDKAKAEPRSIRFDGMELKLNEDTKILEEKELEKTAYSFFDLTDEYLSTKKELDVYIKADSMEVSSPASEESRMEREYAQMIPNAVDPNNAQAAAMHPLPLWDAVALAEEYASVKKLPEKLLLNKSSDDSVTVKKAEDDVMRILNGEYVEAIPGQPAAHLEYQYKVREALLNRKQDIEDQINKDLSNQMEEMDKIIRSLPPRFDPATGMPVEIPTPEPEPNIELSNSLEKVDKALSGLEEHIFGEAMPASMINTRITMGGGQSQAPEVPMPPGGDPMMAGGGQMPPEMMGMQGSPMDMMAAGAVPNQPNMTMQQ